jgi:hypothetical protein
LSLAIDAPAVVGGGYLRFDPQKAEYSGILQLEVAETIAVKAIGLLTTRMPDGSQGFSLVIIMSAEGFAPIQLGFGFTLTGIGGCWGSTVRSPRRRCAPGSRTTRWTACCFRAM